MTMAPTSSAPTPAATQNHLSLVIGFCSSPGCAGRVTSGTLGPLAPFASVSSAGAAGGGAVRAVVSTGGGIAAPVAADRGGVPAGCGDAPEGNGTTGTLGGCS